MKIFIAFALLTVGISALPQQLRKGIALNNERFVTDAIASAIEELSQDIRNAGLDPFYIQKEKRSYALPVPVIFSTEAEAEELLFQGLSDIVINNMSYSIIFNRLRFDISLPLVELTANNVNVDTVFFGEQINVVAAGRFAIKNINVAGEVRVNIGIISGISVRSIDINFKLGGIVSKLSVAVANYDLSNWINTFCGTIIPQTFDKFENEINELIEIVALEIINANL